jgi:hypothetical protein
MGDDAVLTVRKQIQCISKERISKTVNLNEPEQLQKINRKCKLTFDVKEEAGTGTLQKFVSPTPPTSPEINVSAELKTTFT